MLELIKEIRQWIITIIVVIVVGGIIWQIRSCGIDSIIKDKTELEQQKAELEQKIIDLEKDLNKKPKEKVVIKEKEIIVNKCFENIDGEIKEVKCDSNYKPIEVKITKEDCCKLGLGAYIETEYFICEDKDICKEGDASIRLTETGKKKFQEIKTDIQNIGKSSIWKFSIFGGYDVVPSYFIIGIQFLDWHNLGLAIDIGSDFKHFSNSRAGVAGVYRPYFWSATTNLGFGIGLSTPIKELSKEVMLQAMILFYIIDF